MNTSNCDTKRFERMNLVGRKMGKSVKKISVPYQQSFVLFGCKSPISMNTKAVWTKKIKTSETGKHKYFASKY